MTGLIGFLSDAVHSLVNPAGDGRADAIAKKAERAAAAAGIALLVRIRPAVPAKELT